MELKLKNWKKQIRYNKREKWEKTKKRKKKENG